MKENVKKRDIFFYLMAPDMYIVLSESNVNMLYFENLKGRLL
jgi:hypothetical protein